MFLLYPYFCPKANLRLRMEMNAESKKMVILLVNYFNEEEVCFFVERQIARQTSVNIDIVITDNGSHHPERLTSLANRNSFIFVYKAGDNLGYLPGAAFGLKNYLEEGRPIPDAVILSNSDIEFAGQDFLQRIVSGEEHSSYDILGPDIFSDLLFHHQNPLMKERISIKKLKMLAFLSSNVIIHYLFLTWHYTKSRLRSKRDDSKLQTGEVVPVYGLHGSFMVFNHSFFDKGGNLDYPMKLFGEEIFLAEMALKLSLRCGYDPSLKLIHHEHKTTGIYKSRGAVRLLNKSYRFLVEGRIENGKWKIENRK